MSIDPSKGPRVVRNLHPIQALFLSPPFTSQHPPIIIMDEISSALWMPDLSTHPVLAMLTPDAPSSALPRNVENLVVYLHDRPASGGQYHLIEAPPGRHLLIAGLRVISCLFFDQNSVRFQSRALTNWLLVGITWHLGSKLKAFHVRNTFPNILVTEWKSEFVACRG